MNKRLCRLIDRLVQGIILIIMMLVCILLSPLFLLWLLWSLTEEDVILYWKNIFDEKYEFEIEFNLCVLTAISITISIMYLAIIFKGG